MKEEILIELKKKIEYWKWVNGYTCPFDYDTLINEIDKIIKQKYV